MSLARRRAEQAAAPSSTSALRLMTVLDVLPGMGDDLDPATGRPTDLVRLDWTGDGTVPVPARCNPDAHVTTSGVEVLVALVDRTPVVVCRTAGIPPA